GRMRRRKTPVPPVRATASVLHARPFSACSATTRPATPPGARPPRSVRVTVATCPSSTLRVLLRTASVVDRRRNVPFSQPALGSAGPSAEESALGAAMPAAAGTGGTGTYIRFQTSLACPPTGLAVGLT